ARMAFDQRFGVGGRFAREVQREQVVHHVVGHLHRGHHRLLGDSVVAAVSLRRARCTRIFTVLTEMPSTRPISAKSTPIAANINGSRYAIGSARIASSVRRNSSLASAF